LWLTTSLRGVLVGELDVKILKEAVHSGLASGIVPSTFRIARQLLDRVEDVKTGEILGKPFHCEIPPNRLEEATSMADVLGEELLHHFPFVDGAHAIEKSYSTLLLNQTWRPALSITGADGLPSLTSAGNVIRTHTTLKLSLRLPPNVEPHVASEHLKQLLEKDPPYGAKVTFTSEKGGAGWESPALAHWLTDALTKSSESFFKKGFLCTGEGGSIPFMGMLGKKFPAAQFMIVGVLGPASNAHGPNEFFDIAMAQNLTKCVSYVVHTLAHKH